MDFNSFEQWSAEGAKDHDTRGREKARNMLKDYEEPKLDEGIAEGLRDFIAQREANLLRHGELRTAIDHGDDHTQTAATPRISFGHARRNGRMNAPLANDPLLRPYRLKHLTLKNRVMSTSHEPAYSEDGMPKERYRLYHAEKAKGGMALTMTAGSAIVSRDSPAAFGNLHVYRDEIVPWLRELADSCHEHDCKVMIQITHLGRRTGWNKADWLPVLAPSPVREPAHRAFPKTMEDWDIDRIVADYASAAQRCQAAGLDGIEFESYGHLMDGFWSPLTNHRDDEFNGSLDNRLRFTWPCHRRGARGGGAGLHRRHPHGRRRGFRQGPVEGGGRRDRAPAGGVRQIRLPQHHPRHDRDRRGADRGHPDHRHGVPRRISTSQAKCGRRRSSRSSTPRASPMLPPRAMRSPRASSTWSG